MKYFILFSLIFFVACKKSDNPVNSGGSGRELITITITDSIVHWNPYPPDYNFIDYYYTIRSNVDTVTPHLYTWCLSKSQDSLLQLGHPVLSYWRIGILQPRQVSDTDNWGNKLMWRVGWEPLYKKGYAIMYNMP
jgi:hypothetical protein